MRLWSLHPRYLDARGLVALWREGLLAQAVLAGRTRGYRQHPQLDRFRASRDPQASIAAYLRAVLEEARRRDYRFDAGKIACERPANRLPVSRGQLVYERDLLAAKLAGRAPALAVRFRDPAVLLPHPLFYEVPGGIERWEVLPA